VISSPGHKIEFRHLTEADDLKKAVTFQQAVWGYADLDTESHAILTVASRFSGQVIGAFAGEEMIGLSVAFGTMKAGRLHSHRVGVLPAYQNAGIGRQIKLAQREDALARGMKVIQWTFDPLQPRNAHINLRKLGGIARTYIPNIYGITSSPLHGGLPTDRLLLEWELDSERVRRSVAGETPLRSPHTTEIRLPAESERRNLAAQQTLRGAFEEAFTAGYTLTDIERSGAENIYLLEKL
jgi:predicted GNAT superfamily acetyltransferase